MWIFIFIGVAIFVLIFHTTNRPGKLIKPGPSDAVLITGCDSGIGYSLACHCIEQGISVLATCLRLNSVGAQHLLQLHRELCGVRVIEMDVRQMESVENALSEIKRILSEQPNLVLKALVNNAGVMVFGDCLANGRPDRGANRCQSAWSNEGYQSVSPNDCRVINITSHCSLQALPGLSAYAASKAGLLVWSDALRIETKKFGVPIISMIPGALFTATNIMANQKKYAERMKNNMRPEEWELYRDYFMEYNSYLTGFDISEVKKIDDRRLYTQFDDALLSTKPRSHYSNSPFRYIFYHTLFKIAPTWMCDWLVVKFVNLPEWKK